jgi:hypothetical protein
MLSTRRGERTVREGMAGYASQEASQVSAGADT